jgi:glycosyltransferase involved in cell wall biosynthesis
VSAAVERASRYGPLGRAALPSVGDVVALSSVLRRIKPDLVHTNTVKAHVLGVPAARLAGVPSVMHVRDALNCTGRVAISYLGRYAAAQSIAVSNSVADWYSIPRTRVVYNALDLTRYDNVLSAHRAREILGLPQRIPLVGVVGPIHRGKGHDRFLRSFQSLAQQTDSAAVIVGDVRFRDDDVMPRIMQLAKDLGIVERLFFVPWLSDPRIAYAALDVVCSCSTREPFGRSISEAAACSTPSAMFSDSGVSELFKDTISAAIVSPYDEVEFGRRLVDLVSNPLQRFAMGAAAREAVESLTLSRHAKEISSIYAEVRARRRLRHSRK